MSIVLGKYQEEAKQALLANRKWGLFDEPGVGKTFPTIAAAQEVLSTEGGQALITVPAYLIPNWEREIRRYCGDDAEIALVTGEPHHRRAALDSGATWVLTSYNNWSNFESLTAAEKTLVERGATVTRRLRYPQLMKNRWAVFAYDEAHRLRGRNSLWTKEMMRLHNMDSKNRESRFWYLTGTPFVRDGGDIFTFLKNMDRQRFSSYWRFVEEWCVVTDTPWQKDVGGIRPGLEEAFNVMLKEYSLRRQLKDIPELAQLEVIGPKVIPIKLPASVYTTMRNAKKEWVLDHPDLASPEALTSGGQLIHRLRVMSSLPPTTANPVMDSLCDLLEDHNEPVIVWCWYRDTATQYTEALAKRTKRKVWMISGDVGNADRQSVIDQWQRVDNGIMVATVAALKEGANLQHSACQVFVECSDLPTDNEQAIARSKRRGQDRPVRVYHLIPEQTESARVFRNQDKRGVQNRRALLEEIRRELL